MKAVETMRSATSCVACEAVLQAARCGHCGAAAVVRGYQVQRVLAEQPHSRVYLAAQPGGPAVVLKELTFSLVPNAQTLESFQREAGLLRQLSHPRLPTFLDAFQDGTGVETRLYLAMTYVEGRSLQDELEMHRFSESEALDIAARALELLVYLHGLSPPVIHRDVKPANLLRRPDGTLSLVDFGAAREVQRTTSGQATLVGTVGYMPPEQFVGVTTPGGDVYALGATLVHLLSRTPPGELMGPDLRLEFKKRVNLGAPALAWLTRLVHRHPRRRFATAAQALEALQAVRSGKVGRQRVLFAVGRGLGLAAVAVGGLVVFRPQVERLVIAALDMPMDEAPAVAAPDTQAVKSPTTAMTAGADTPLQITCPAGTTLAEDGKKRMRWCSHTSASGHQVRHGPFVSWDTDGDLAERSSYADDKLHGTQVLMHDGKKASEGEWVQGKKTGLWLGYETFGGHKKVQEATYKDDALEGPWRHFGYDGALEDEGQYKDGQKQGVWSHYRGRDKEFEATFVHDKRNGPYTSWHQYDKFIGEKGDYVDGHKTGPWVVYFANGQKQAEGLYEADRQEGPWNTWHESGALASQGAYVKGQKTGPWVTWFQKDQKESEGLYERDQEVGTWLHWHANGARRSEVLRQPDGLVRTTTWFSNGQMESQHAEKSHRNEGPATTWYENGKKKAFTLYDGGERKGMVTTWHSNGRKESEGRYAGYQQAGTWRWWDSTGKLQRVENFKSR